MKKIVYLAFAFAIMTSCTKVEDAAKINKDVTCSVGFNLSTVVSSEVSSSPQRSSSIQKSQQAVNTTDAFLSKLTGLEIKNYHSFNSLFDLTTKKTPTNILKVSHTDARVDAATDVFRFNMNEIKLGYNTFIASATQGTAVVGYTALKGDDDYYKHYVGITRTITEKDNDVRTKEENTFIPQVSNWPWQKHSIMNKDADDTRNPIVLNKVLNISAQDVPNGNYNKEIVMEMTPENSVIALNVKNERNDLVMIFSTKTIVAGEDAHFDNFIVENTADKAASFLLNSEYLKVGATTEIKVYVARALSVTTKSADISSMNNSEFKTHFTILNGGGAGQSISFEEGAEISIKGNQIYKNKTSIILKKEAFTISSDMLILFNKEWNESEITFDGWEW